MTRQRPIRHNRPTPTYASSRLPSDVRSETQICVVMDEAVHCVHPAMSVECLTTFLLEEGLSAAPVIDRGALVGMVSMTDLMREVHDRGEDEERIALRAPDADGMQSELGNGFHATRLARSTVGEIMTPIVFSLRDSDSVRRAAALMAFEGVGQLPVVGASGAIVGIVSALDVMRWLARESSFVRPPGPGNDEPGEEEPGDEDDRPHVDAVPSSASTLPALLAFDDSDSYFVETPEPDGWSEVRRRTMFGAEESTSPEPREGASRSHTRLVAQTG